MFEVGKVYTIRMEHPSGATSFKGILLEADLPLICIEHGDGQRIVNVNSPLFLSADRADDETAAGVHDRHEANRRARAAITNAAPIDIFEAYESHKDDPPGSPG